MWLVGLLATWLQSLQAWFQKFLGFAPSSHCLERSCNIRVAPVPGGPGSPSRSRCETLHGSPPAAGREALSRTCLLPTPGAMSWGRSLTGSQDGPAGRSPQTCPCPLLGQRQGQRRDRDGTDEELQQ